MEGLRKVDKLVFPLSDQRKLSDIWRRYDLWVSAKLLVNRYVVIMFTVQVVCKS